MDFLEPRNVRFSRSGSSVRVDVSGAGSYSDVELVRAFPHSRPEECIAVVSAGKQMGMLREIASLDPESRRVVEEELRRRYFIPTIRNVRKVTHDGANMTWEVVTDKGERRICTMGYQDSISEVGDKLVLTDVDGGRYYLLPQCLLPQRGKPAGL